MEQWVCLAELILKNDITGNEKVTHECQNSHTTTCNPNQCNYVKYAKYKLSVIGQDAHNSSCGD